GGGHAGRPGASRADSYRGTSDVRLTLLTGAFPLRSQAFIVNKATALAHAGHQVSVFATARGDDDLDVVDRSVGLRYQSAVGAALACVRHPRRAARLTRAV